MLSFLFGELVGGNETLVALGTYEFGIRPAHPAKAKPKNRDNRHEAAKLVQTLEFLFEPSNGALLQPLIAKQKFPDSFFYHFFPPPQNTQRERVTGRTESLKVNMRLKCNTEFQSVQNVLFMIVKETLPVK